MDPEIDLKRQEISTPKDNDSDEKKESSDVVSSYPMRGVMMRDFPDGGKIIDSNTTCCDCTASDPTWALLSHGVLVWYDCLHKQNVSFVRHETIYLYFCGMYCIYQIE